MLDGHMWLLHHPALENLSSSTQEETRTTCVSQTPGSGTGLIGWKAEGRHSGGTGENILFGQKECGLKLLETDSRRELWMA